MSHKHRAEIIEIYEYGAKAAVKFSNGRVECVCKRGASIVPFKVGQRGWVDYTRSLHGFEWVFKPFRSEIAKAMREGIEQAQKEQSNEDVPN